MCVRVCVSVCVFLGVRVFIYHVHFIHRLGLVQIHCLLHEDQPVDTDSHGVDVVRVHGVANSAWFDHEDTLDDEDVLPHSSVYLNELSEYCLPPSERAGTPENVPTGFELTSSLW